MAHSILAPSSASRWLHCHLSVKLIREAAPEETTSTYAEEGTRAHAFAESLLQAWLKGDSDAIDRLTTSPPEGVDEEMVHYAGEYVSYVQQLYRDCLDPMPPTSIELSIPLFYRMADRGTADVIMVDRDKRELHVIDLKYGKGIQVYSEDNDQLRAYGQSVREQYDVLFDFDTVTLHIAQPRLDHFDACTYSLAELDAWAQTVRDAVSAIGAGSDLACASDTTCKWCPVKATCPELFNTIKTEVVDLFAGAPDPDVTQVPVSDRERVFALKGLVDLWYKTISEDMHEHIDQYPGYKLIAGRMGARVWSDASAMLQAAEFAGIDTQEVYQEPKIQSPAQLEKSLKVKDIPKAVIDEILSIAVQSEGKPKLVPASDKRPSITTDIIEKLKG